MNILVVGTGAVGGYYGALLHRSGHDVTLVARGEHLEAIRGSGLRIESVTSGDFTIRPAATDRPDGSWKADLALFCVKGYDNPSAIETMAPAVGKDTSVLTLQNGIGSGDELAAAFGEESVLLGVTYVDAVKKGPGVVAELGGECSIVFGETVGGPSARGQAVRQALDGAGIEVRHTSNVTRELWNKLLFICGLSGMTCITRAPFSEVLDMPETLDMASTVVGEAEAVARAKGIDLDPDIVDGIMSRYQTTGRNLLSSMFTDLKRGNPLEVGVLNGAVAKLVDRNL